MVDKIKEEEEEKKPVEAKPEEEEKKKQEPDEEEEEKKKEFPVQDNGMGKMVALLEAIASKLGVGEGGVPAGEPVADIAQKGGVVDEPEKLPKTPEDNASISQTADAPEETDKVPEMEKSIEKVMKDVLKSYGIEKSMTPRPATAKQAPVEVKKKEDKPLSGLDILKSHRDGKSVGWADIHKDVRKFDKKNMETIFGQKE